MIRVEEIHEKILEKLDLSQDIEDEHLVELIHEVFPVYYNLKPLLKRFPSP